jgi:hypothetical protein
VSDGVVTGAQSPPATGGPGDLAAAFGEALIAAAKKAPADTSDPRVTTAFAVGWQMAELYRPQRLRRHESQPDDLPGLSALAETDRIEILVDQIQAGVNKLKPSIEGSGLPLPDLGDLRGAIAKSQPERAVAVLELHRHLLGTLTATDFRLGKAYGMGRALADTCRKPDDPASLKVELGRHRIATLLAWLDSLASALPAHGAHPVATSLERWRDWVETAATERPSSDTLAALRHQGDLWRALLSGEKTATTTLEIGNYVDAARDLATQLRTVLLAVIRRFPVLTVLVIALFVGGIVLLAAGGAGHLVAGATSVLAAVGLTWKGLGATLGQLAGRVEQPLWGAALDAAIADAITLLPNNSKDERGRLALALEMPQQKTPV